MTTQFTPNFNLAKPGDGDTGWGSALSANMDVIDAALSASGLYVGSFDSTDATAHEVPLPALPTSCIVLANGSGGLLAGRIIGLAPSAGVAASWRVAGMVRCYTPSGGSPTVDISNVMITAETPVPTGWTVTVVADNASRSIRFQVKGVTGQSVVWGASIQWNAWAAPSGALPPPPNLVVSTTTLSFSAGTNGVAPTPQTFAITNGIAGTILTWSVGVTTTSGGAWLSCTPTTGNGSTVLTASVNPTGLVPGTYFGTITITAPGATSSPQTIAVSLMVLTGYHLAFTVQPGGGKAGQPLTQQPSVAVRDANNAVVIAYTGAITLTLTSGAGAVLGTITKNAVAGQVAWTDIGLDTAQNNVTLTASGPGLTSATSTPFNVMAPIIGATPTNVILPHGIAGGSPVTGTYTATES